MKDYYKILQVASDASPEVIQMAYKALAKISPGLKSGTGRSNARENERSE